MRIWNTDTLRQFTNNLYNNLLKHEHIVSNEVTKKIEEDVIFGYELEKQEQDKILKDRYFVRTQDIEKLPIRVRDYMKFSHKSEVFKLVTACESYKIPSRQELNFRQLVDFYADYAHSQPDDWKLARIIILASYFERLNIRLVSEASFGKDALVDILNILNGGVSNLYNATLGKLKYALNNDLIIINELGGLKKEDVATLQVYLTQAGAWKPVYENNSRASIGTKETVDLSDKSHVIYHNTPDYYNKKSQQYFEEMFTHALVDRFPALLLEGYVEENFSHSPDINDFDTYWQDMLKKTIATLNYYKDNPINTPRFSVEPEFWDFNGKELQRSLRSFEVISKYLAEYSNTKEEFVNWCQLLKDKKDNYREMLYEIKLKG